MRCGEESVRIRTRRRVASRPAPSLARPSRPVMPPPSTSASAPQSPTSSRPSSPSAHHRHRYPPPPPRRRRHPTVHLLSDSASPARAPAPLEAPSSREGAPRPRPSRCAAPQTLARRRSRRRWWVSGGGGWESGAGRCGRRGGRGTVCAGVSRSGQVPNEVSQSIILLPEGGLLSFRRTSRAVIRLCGSYASMRCKRSIASGPAAVNSRLRSFFGFRSNVAPDVSLVKP